MADKLHTLTSNLIKFAAGEKPSADKFNAANEYFSRSLREISRAIGDIRDQGYPHSSDANKYTHLTGAWNPYEIGREEGRPLDIVNIARLIGPASNLNPKMLDFETTKVEIVSGSLMEYQLSFPLKENGTIIIGAGNPLTRVTTDYFTGTNQFLVRGNVVYFSSSHNTTRGIIYETSTSAIDGGSNYIGASFNVIPDPNQPTKLSIIPLQNEINAYSVDFGLCTHQQSGIRTKESLKLSSLNAGEYNNNLPLKLPTWMWSGENPRFENGDAIPEGFLVLKNLTTNEVYQNASYFFISPTEIHVKGISLCVDHEFCVITVGTDITTSIDDLRNKMFLHKHDGSFGEPKVSVRDLVEKFSEYSAIVYGESSIPNNHFPMYLHRSGYNSDTNLNNGNNAMLGALMMGNAAFNSLDAANFPSVTPSPTTVDSLGHASQGIFFSSFDCYIVRETNGTLLLKNSNYKNIDIEARNLNLTSTAEIILNAPGGLSLLSQGDNNFSYVSINTTGPVFNQAGTFNNITAATDINIIAGEKLKVDAAFVNISHENELSQSYYSKTLGTVSSGYKRLDNTASSWLNKADIESTVYKYKIEITPSTNPNQVIPSCKDSFLTTNSFRTEAHFITDMLVANVSKYDATTNQYVSVADHQNVQLVQAWESIDWKTKKYRMDYLDPSLFIHYKKEISKTLTDAENQSYGLWNGQNSSQGIAPSRRVFENPADYKAKFSITGENRVRYSTNELDLPFRRTSANSWNPNTLISSVNEYDITPTLQRYVNDFELTGDAGLRFPPLRMNWFNYSGDDTQYSLSDLISRYFLIKVERAGRGISWLRTKQVNQAFPEAEVSISDSPNGEFVHLNITATLEHLLWDQDEIYDNFVNALSSGEYTISVVRTFRDSGYSSLNADVVRKIDGAFRVAFAKDSIDAGSKAMVDGTGAEAGLLNIYRNSSNVGNIGYSSVGNNRHKLIIARDNLPTSTSEFKTRKFRVLIEGGEGKGAYVFLKEDWVLDGEGAGYYNWREVVNLALRYPGETTGKKIEIYINGKKMGGRANVIEGVVEYEYKDIFDLPVGGNILNITELIKIAYGEITKGLFYKSENSLMSFGASVAYPLGADLDGSYLGVDSVGNINGNTFSYHHFDLDLDCKETYNPFTGNVKLEINMSIITKRMGQASTGTSYDA